MTACSICRLAIRDDGTIFQAFGRPLFPVHATCAPVVHAGMRLLDMTALQVGCEALRYRTPTAFAALEGARAVVQRFGELQAQNNRPVPPVSPPQARQARRATWTPPENVIDVQGA